MDLAWLKNRWKGWREKNFLYEHGCKTWREYELKYDPDVRWNGQKGREFYKGYEFVIPYRFYPHNSMHYSSETLKEMVEWCTKNCSGKWRNDWQRVYSGWTNDDDFEFNGLGNEDIMYFAFKKGEDATNFLLVWA